MKALLKFIPRFSFVFWMCVAVAHITVAQPVAFVYVVSNPSAGKYQVNAYTANSAGHLTPVPGSPFPENVQTLAVNGKYLFASNGVDIFTYSIASNGALKLVTSINARQYNSPNNTGGPYFIVLDHTSSTLYDVDIYGNNGANNDYQFFDINQTSGVLTYLGVSDATTEYWTPLRFTGNNEYAYGADWVHFNDDIYGYRRESSGALTKLNINPPIPTAKAGSGYVTYLAEADPKNNLAISLTPVNGSTWQIDGPPQIAVYTADNSGNLTTHSTSANMPATAVKDVQDMAMSPSGNLLAVGGSAGLQVFHFNRSNPATKFTGLLMKNPISSDDQMFWDNANHLYVISSSANKLYVFTITPTSAKQAPGSPYTLTKPVNIIVLPKT